MLIAMLAAVAGYVAAIFTWPAIRAWLVGREEEIATLRQRARDLERKLRGS